MITTSFFSFNIDIETGQIKEETGYKTTVDLFLKQQLPIILTVECLNCNFNNTKYEYTGKITRILGSDRFTHVFSLTESVYINGMLLVQNWANDTAYIAKKSIRELNSKDIIDIRPIDLTRVSAEHLENKLKTYILFS